MKKIIPVNYNMIHLNIKKYILLQIIYANNRKEIINILYILINLINTYKMINQRNQI